MREILFRGKSVRDNKWVYGFYWSNENGNHFIRQLVDLDGCFTVADIEVNPETIGQYTGLKDKNGVKIFEGDILKFSEVDTAIVEWNEKYASFVVKSIQEYYSTGYRDIEVIGNIWDNPELLEEE